MRVLYRFSVTTQRVEESADYTTPIPNEPPFFCSPLAKLDVQLTNSLEAAMKLKVGQPAPDFELPGHLGKSVRLRDLRGQNVVLAFFPLAWTPI